VDDHLQRHMGGSSEAAGREEQPSSSAKPSPPAFTKLPPAHSPPPYTVRALTCELNGPLPAPSEPSVALNRPCAELEGTRGIRLQDRSSIVFLALLRTEAPEGIPPARRRTVVHSRQAITPPDGADGGPAPRLFVATTVHL
jgi:hypothetical protein